MDSFLERPDSDVLYDAPASVPRECIGGPSPMCRDSGHRCYLSTDRASRTSGGPSTAERTVIQLCDDDVAIAGSAARSPSPSDDGRQLFAPDGGLFASPSRFLTQYDDFEELGHGDFGAVTAARNMSDNQRYAVKHSRQPIHGATEEQHRLQEVYALSIVGTSRHVLRYFDAWIDDERLFIATELVNEGSVRNQPAPWDEQRLWHLTLQAAIGIHALHSSNVAHLDIKPENLLCQRDPETGGLIVKIGDFGLARPLDTEYMPGCVGLNDDEGDARYLCPVLLSSPDSPFLKEADMYALGMSLIDLAGGDPRNVRNSGDYSCVSHLSPRLVDLIRRLTCPQPNGRPTAFDSARIATEVLVEAGEITVDARSEEELTAKLATVEQLRREVEALEARLNQ